MRPSLNLELPDPEWLALLKTEQAKGKTVVQISKECGIARSSLSMLLSGSYPAKSLDLVARKHATRVVRIYRGQLLCPHLNRGLGEAECHAFRTAPMSTSHPGKLRHWRACQGCQHNTERNPK